MIDSRFLNEYNLIGKNIRSRRKELRLTQSQLASKIDGKIDHAKISDIENSKEDFQFITLLKICEGLEITLKDLINFNDNKNSR